MKLRLIFISLGCLSLVCSPAAEPPLDLSVVREVPYFPLLTLQQIVGSHDQVWNWKWKELDTSQYTPQIKQLVETDISVVLSEPGNHPKWYQSPLKLDLVLKNPTRPFIYFVFIPASEEIGSLDENLVYVYDTKNECLIYNTYADPETDYGKLK